MPFRYASLVQSCSCTLTWVSQSKKNQDHGNQDVELVASFCSTRRRTLSSISYYYLLAILSLPHSLFKLYISVITQLSCSLTAFLGPVFVWFLWISARWWWLSSSMHPSALSVVELYMYSHSLPFLAHSNLCLRAALVSLVPLRYRPNTLVHRLCLVYTSLFS